MKNLFSATALFIFTILAFTVFNAKDVKSDNITKSSPVVSATTDATNDVVPHYEGEAIYIDSKGDEHPYNPKLRFSSSIVYIGIKLKYTSKAGGVLLKNALNKSYGVGAVGTGISPLGMASGPASLVVTTFVGLGLNGFRNGCKDAINLVNAHPNKGCVIMYTDRCTWSAS